MTHLTLLCAADKENLLLHAGKRTNHSLQASSPIWASEASCEGPRKLLSLPRPQLSRLLSRIYFSQYSPNGELACRLIKSKEVRQNLCQDIMEIRPQSQCSPSAGMVNYNSQTNLC